MNSVAAPALVRLDGLAVALPGIFAGSRLQPGIPFIRIGLRARGFAHSLLFAKGIMLIRIIVLSAAVLSAAPLGAQSVSDDRCRPIPMEDPRPDGEHRADSARSAATLQVMNTLRSGVRDAARQAGVEQPQGLIVLEGNPRRADRLVVHARHANVPEELVRGVVAGHASQLATLPRRRRMFHFRLDSLSVTEAITSNPVECHPRLVNPEQVRELLARVTDRERPLPAGSNPRVHVHVHVVMLVAREGDVAYAELKRRSHSATLDAAILAAARTLRFAPATLGGERVDVWAELPMVLALPVAPRQDNRP